ncbi:rod-binding protein [Desulfococcus sp.]|uniref:rod-binding protein n=1 Tax=Desulfococcus sp. TaxID=2025834 RepID=UPI0035940C6D
MTRIQHLPENPWPMYEKRSAAGKNHRAATEADAPGGAGAAKTRTACAEMESLFIYHLLREMQSTVPKSGLMGGGTAANMYTDMLHQHLSRELAEGGGIGLADILMAQLTEGRGRASDEK